MERKLKDLSKEDYRVLSDSGMLWEFYPNATGFWEEDCKTKTQKIKETLTDRDFWKAILEGVFSGA